MKFLVKSLKTNARVLLNLKTGNTVFGNGWVRKHGRVRYTGTNMFTRFVKLIPRRTEMWKDKTHYVSQPVGPRNYILYTFLTGNVVHGIEICAKPQTYVLLMRLGWLGVGGCGFCDFFPFVRYIGLSVFYFLLSWREMPDMGRSPLHHIWRKEVQFPRRLWIYSGRNMWKLRGLISI